MPYRAQSDSRYVHRLLMFETSDLRSVPPGAPLDCRSLERLPVFSSSTVFSSHREHHLLSL